MGYKFYAIKFFRTKNKNNSHFSDFDFSLLLAVTVGKEYILIDEKNIQLFIKFLI